jgi:hypothetical protein
MSPSGSAQPPLTFFFFKWKGTPSDTLFEIELKKKIEGKIGLFFNKKPILYTRNQGIQNLRNSFLRGFPLPFNVETLQAFGALFQIPHYYRKFSDCKLKMLFNLIFR